MPASGKLRVVEQRRPELRAPRSWKILLAHDARTAACDALVVALDAALVNLELVDASSVDDARLAAATEAFDACLICLDLPPAPTGGVRLASELLSNGHAIVLVTRSLRWVPLDRPALQQLPWIPPDAGPAEISGAVAAATGEFDTMVRERAPSLDDLAGARLARARR